MPYTSLAEVKNYLVECGCENAIVFGEVEDDDHYATAFVGHSADGRAIYDYERMVEWYIAKHNCPYLDAVEFIDYNAVGSYMGEKTPIVVYTPNEE